VAHIDNPSPEICDFSATSGKKLLMSGYELSHGTSFSEHSLLEVIHDIEPDHLNRKCLTDSFGYFQ
jgi:hypothetical protein